MTKKHDLARCVGYCRVSTQRQHVEGHGLERYIEQLKHYGLTDEQIHWDVESGANEKRIGYNRVLELVRLGQVDKIIVPCFDRFTRSALGWEVARQELQQFEVELVFLDGGSLDLETPEGLFTGRILAAMSAHVRDKNKYNALQGHKYFRAKHKSYQAIFGFEKIGDNVRPNRNPYKNSGKAYADIATEAIDMFLDTGELANTIRKLIDKYGRIRIGDSWSQDFPRDITAFRDWLKNPQLCGRIRYYPKHKDKTVILDSNNEPLISIEKFNEIQLLLIRPPKLRVNHGTNPLVYIARCESCNSKMLKHVTKYNNVSGNQTVYESIRCSGAYPRCHKEKICNNRQQYKLDKGMQFVIEQLNTKTQLLPSLLWDDIEINKNTPHFTNEMRQLQQQIEKLKSLNDSELDDIIKTKETRLQSLFKETELDNIRDERRSEFAKLLRCRSDFLESLTRDELTVVFSELVKSLTCCIDGSFKLELNI